MTVVCRRTVLFRFCDMHFFLMMLLLRIWW